VLGPVVVGEGAKIGSNAVVVKDVPAGRDRGGDPGAGHSRRAGQDARGEGGEAGVLRVRRLGQAEDDPLAKAVQGLLDHSVDMDERIELILNQIEELRGEREESRGSFAWDPRWSISS